MALSKRLNTAIREKDIKAMKALEKEVEGYRSFKTQTRKSYGRL